jgi:GNAT superfamily N-acetyltransferase
MADLIVPTTGTVANPFTPDAPTAPAAPAQSPAAAYLASTAQTAQSNIALAVGANPDYEAEMLRLAQQTGTPVDSVRAFPDAVKQKAAVSSIDFQSLAKQFPSTAAFYQSQNNAKIAHDDVPGMQAVERATTALGPAGNTVPLAPGTTGYFQPDNSPLPLRERMMNWGRNLLGLDAAVPTGNAQGAGSAQAFIQNYAKQNGMTVGQERDAVGGMSEIPTQFAQGFENSFTAGLAPDVNGPAQTTSGQVASGLGTLAGFVTGAPLKMAAGAVEKVGGSLLEHVAGESFAKAAAKDVIGQASTLGLASAITATGDALNQSSPEAALTTIGLQGLHGAEMGGVFGAAGRILPDSTAVQTIARVVGVNAMMDAIQGTSIGDDRSTAQKVMDYGLNSFFALHGAGRATGAWVRDAAKADVATGDAQTLADLATSAANSKLRPRDPQAFKDFVATANADGPVQNVYVEAATLANALNQSGVKIGDVESTMPRVAQQLPEALATGGDVSIPVEDFATHIAGGPLGDTLMPHLKTDPDGMTQQQAQEFYQSSKETFQQATEAASADKANDDAVAQSAQVVHDNVLDQLTQANRFRPDVNKVYAALVRDSYTAAGARAGLSPESMFERYPLRITAEDAPGANALNQPLPSLDAVKQAWQDAGIDGSISEGKDRITLSKIVVPEDSRGTGIGTAAMRQLIDYADAAGKHVVLSPSADFGGNKARLKDFYKGFGFVENKGKNRAFSTTESMYREAPGKVLEQDARGKLSFSDDITSAPSTITLNKDADLSTFVHELGHFHLEMLSHMSNDGALPEVGKDFDTAMQWLGTTPEAWRSMSLEDKRDMHEQFARGFEAYLFEGKAPTPELQGVFQRVRAWMINVYRSLQNLGVQLSPEVRGVFDRLLATNDAIRGAEAERAYTPMFHTAEEAGMTPEEFQAYHALGNEATLEASDELTARTLRDMRFTEIAKDRASKEVRADVAAKRAAVREQVIEDVAKEPAYAAQDFLLGQANKEHQIPADLVAERFGFANADEMTKAIADAEPRSEVVEALTDQRMLEKYGDITSPQAMNAAANQAIHNEVRTRFIATEYKALTKATGGVRVLEKAAKAAAETAIAAARVRDINASKYGAAEARAARAADAARLKGDLTEAAQQKRNQLLNNQLEKTARAAAAEVLKSLQYLKKFNKESARGKIDVDVRDQIDDMLARFDLRTNPVDTPTRQQINLEKWVESQTALGMAPNVSPDMLNPAFRTPYRDMTMEQFRGLTDAVKSLEKIGRDRKTATINGEKQDVQQYVTEHLIPKMQARGDQFSDAEIFDKPADRSNNPMRIALDHLTSQLRAIKAQLKPQEYKRNQYDMHELLGPFGEAIYEPVFRANYREVDMLKGMSDDFKRMADHLGREWQDSLKEGVTNTRLMDVNRSTDNAQVPLRMNRGKMIGVALHVGNESNFDKLTSGWKWNPQDVWRFLHDNMTEKDWKAVQSVWDQYDKHWPDMAAMNQRLGNTSPERIEPRAFQTKFGEQRGGYAAIKYDPLRSRRGQIESAGRAIDPGEGLFGKSYYRPDTTTNGSLNARNQGYTDVVDLDFHTIPQTMTESIHDLAYRETLIDVHKIISNGDFRRQFQKTYGPEAYRSLQEWLGKTANADNQDREVGALGKILQYTRTGIVINGIAFRISTVLKHGGSAAIKTGGYFTGGGEKFLAARFAAMGTNYAAEIRGAQEKFPEIRARLLQQDRDFRAMSANLFEPESKMSKAERFGHAAVAWSDMMTAVPTAWAAYDRAITVGIPKNMGGTGAPMTEEQAVAYASKVVREAHGSNITTARSMVINNSSEAVKMFTTLYGFMNNSYGQAADIADKLKTAGISNPQTLARGFMALIVPAIWAGYLTEGPPHDKDGWAHWIGKSIAIEVAGMVPFVRDAAAMVEGYSHAGQVGVESFLNTLVGAGKDVYHLATGQHVNAPIKDIANAAGMGLHIPGLGQAGGSAQYLADVASGKQHPKDALDVAEGVALGRAPKH